MQLPLPGVVRPTYAIFAHGGELDPLIEGHRRAAFERASRILTNSEFTARRVREDFPAVGSRVHPVPLCIDPDLIELWERDLHDAPTGRKSAVLIVGRLWSSERGKGHDALLAALPRVRERVPGAELWIVGTGDDAPRLERAAHELGLAGAVRFFGRVSDRDLGRLYRSAGVYAMPSRQEGFGLVYAEAMWHGLPCIGSTLDAAGDVISDGRTGLLVPYGEVAPLADAIVALLSDRDSEQGMGRAASAEARRRFTYPRFRTDLLRALGLESAGSD
jgi:phosphatidylinositol alpha-1,6-mannosyltransferase